MAEYTFHTLSDADFEDLACDLLSASLNLHFQSFAKGRDSGVDLLHGARLSGSTIVQCKHYCRSKLANLKSKLAEEAPKLRKLKPSRFILATSLSLTPQNKEQLAEIIAPFVQGIDDIYGQDEINALLRRHSEIETAHHKLWLTSTPVLQRVLRHGAAVWNAMTKEDIERKMSLYVQTEAYGIAADILATHNYCILSGIPGIGKTTLAQVLVTRLMDDGYELIAVRDDIQEAFDHLDITKRQVVYYDDFLGQSSVSERLGKNEDRGIIRLLAEARRTKHLKVVFTTREYILEDAKRVYEPLNSGELDIAKCVVKVEDYTRGHRARILYNHVYSSTLTDAYAAALLKDRAYRRIVDHNGYSPRIIEWMTLRAGPTGVEPEAYVAKFVEVLDDPAQLWQHAFENQIAEDSRAILYCLGTVEGWLGLDELRSAWASLRGFGNDAPTMESKKAFMTSLKQLDGSFIRTRRVHNETAIEFHNPSIKDFLRKRIVADTDIRVELLHKARFFEQVSCLVHLSPSGQVMPAPTLLISADAVLHNAIVRTLDAKGATYELIHYRADGQRRLHRVDPDLGARLSAVAEWGNVYGSAELLQLACNIGIEMVTTGDVSRVATVNSCGFLNAVLHVRRDGDEIDNIVKPFVAHIDERLADAPSTAGWTKWTDCVEANHSLFDANDLVHWTERAESFCSDEIDTIIDNADSSTEAEQWYEELEIIARRWSVPIDEDRFNHVLDRLRSREESRDDFHDDWQGSAAPDRAAGNDEEIDRLFDSLTDRVTE